MKDTQQNRFGVSYGLHVISHWLTELGRVFIFATTAAIILSFVNQPQICIRIKAESLLYSAF
ncbi:hypothetical protein CWC30_02755 [Pseudoalteromonas sp. S4741]|nr:hypothetical protein CWC30_02755 [Pseudoalteromonas sp. S4741]